MGTNGNGTKKTGSKTALARPSRNGGARLPLGAHPGNTGGKPGRSGRKSLEFIAECERLTDTVALPKIATYLGQHDPEDQAWRWCVEYVSKYTKSEPPRKVVGQDSNGTTRFTLIIGNPLVAA